jgi:Protein of unknown function (DUF1488)
MSIFLDFRSYILFWPSGACPRDYVGHPSLTLTDGDIMCGGMAAQSHRNTVVALHFPNASRHYNLSQRCVCFWGHDSAFEISFHLDEDALFRMSPHAERDEASLLHAFDVNSARIHETARVAYLRQPQNYYRLSASDLVEPVHRAGKRD